VRGCDFSGCDLPGKNALKAYKSPSIRRPAGPSSVFHLVSPVANGTIILPTRQVLMNAPSILRRPCHLAADGLGPVPGGCGVLQVVKTAQSRGRTERTLFLQHFRNYCGAIKVARCGFPWEKTTKRPVASVCTNCETAYAVISALRRRALAGRSTASRDRRNAAESRNPSLLMSHYRLRSPIHHAGKR
jgi:hypothetical protein